MSNTKFCPNCGHPHSLGEQVCSQCGTPLPGGAPYGQQPTQPMAPPPYNPYGQQPQQPMDPTQPMMQPQQPMDPTQPMMPPQQNNTNMILIIIIAILVVAIAGGVVWYLVNRDKEPDATEQVATIPNIDTVAPVSEAAATEPAVSLDDAPAMEPAKKKSDSPYDYLVDGSIGKYKIKMEISINGGTISGRYRYVRNKGLGGWLMLTGSTSGNSFSMYEENSSGNVTGTFEGSFNKSDSHLSMSGTMWNYKGDAYSYNVSGSAN